jgi:FkbM family methyltransferase
MLKNVLRAVMPEPAWQFLKRIRARQLRSEYEKMLSNYPRRIVEHLYAGQRWKVLIADPDGADWYDKDWPALEEIEFLAAHRLKPPARVFNLGSHQGVVAMMLATKVGPNGSVVAVDAKELNVELARQNAEMNGFSNVTALHAACSDKPGKVRFGLNLNDRVKTGSDEIGYEVDAVSVESLAERFGKPDVVTVDVEGFECAVLSGAGSILNAASTDWFVEVHVNAGLEVFGKTPADVFAFFPEDRYELFVASDRHHWFVPLREGQHLLSDRFYLIAIAR